MTPSQLGDAHLSTRGPAARSPATKHALRSALPGPNRHDAARVLPDRPAHGWAHRPLCRRPSRLSTLGEKMMRLMLALVDTDELLGAQLCVYHRGTPLASVCAGRLGPVDPRPVEPSSLFQLFAAGSPVLATLALQQATFDGVMYLEQPVAARWPAFGAAGKGTIRLLDLLCHRSGLSDAHPPNATVAQLCDPSAMAAHVAAQPATGDGGGVHEGAPWGWALGGWLCALSGVGLGSLLEGRICARLGLPIGARTAELLMSLPEDAAATDGRVAFHDASPLLRRAGLDLNEMLTPSAESAAGAGTGDGETEGATQGSDDGSTDANAAGAAQSVGAMGGVLGQLSPPFLNMQRLRSSELPAVSMHSSARAPAAFYNGITRMAASGRPAAAEAHIGAQQQLDHRSTHEDGGAVAVGESAGPPASSWVRRVTVVLGGGAWPWCRRRYRWLRSRNVASQSL